LTIAGLGFLFVGLLVISGMYWVSAIGCALFVLTFRRYLLGLGKSFSFLEIVAVVATSQWLLGPLIAFYVGDPHYKFHMYVSEETYMSFAVPAVAVFVFGLHAVKPRYNFRYHVVALRKHLARSRGYGIPLVVFGVALDLFSDQVPGSLRFFVFLMAQFKYIGVLYLLLGNHTYRYPVLLAVLTFAVWDSAQTGLFHNLILWSAFIFSFIAYSIQMTNLQKVVCMVVGLVGLVAIQTVKSEFRDTFVRDNAVSERLSGLVELVVDSESYDYDSTYDFVTSLNVRLNQGWIVSAVMHYVPRVVPHENGSTIQDAIVDSLVPRFLVDKKVAKASDKFKQYTGLPLARWTSMGISVLGEAYVNFSVVGGIIFMACWGLTISWFLTFVTDQVTRMPTIFLWVPLIFLQMTKAETDLLVVLNHGVKSIILVFFVYWVSHRILNWRI